LKLESLFFDVAERERGDFNAVKLGFVQGETPNLEEQR
jgi:hypothetical protein